MVVVAVSVAFGDEARAAGLEQDVVVRRSSEEGTLTDDDRLRLREIGLARPQSAAVVVRKIRRADAAQLSRLRALVQAPEGFGPSGACDRISGQGEAHAMCTGHVRGPLGEVPVRMPVAARLVEGGDGSLHLFLSNPRALEAKPFLSWSTVVAPEHLKVSYELFPQPDGWLVYTRVGVEMSAHGDSAKTIADAMLKLDAWLSRELSRM